MPSTAGSAASVGALINSAGSSASVMGIGAGGGSGVGTGVAAAAAAEVGAGAAAAASAGTLIAQSTAGTSAASGTITWDNNGTLRSINPGDWSIEQCLNWQQPHHLYFQLGWAFLFLAFLAPHGPFGSLWMRAMLLIGCIMMGMYGYLVECTPDVVLWSGLGIGVNFIYLIVVLCRLRPVRFEQEIEAVYMALFQPLHVTRHQFKKVLNCMKVIRALKYQEVYAQEKVTKVDSLSLVLSGKLVVSQHQRALHIVFPHQFLDSPEWFGVSTDDYFQVSIMAMEESRVLIWHRDKLKLSIMAEPFLQTVFDHILGRDVVKKLMQVTQVSESIASNGFLPSGGYAEDAEDKPMLILKKSVDVGHGLTALINRQLQEEHVPLLGRTYKQQLQLQLQQEQLQLQHQLQMQLQQGPRVHESSSTSNNNDQSAL
ncbi:blood vessel epicardial substance isoform X1 [Drosophila pseudoobscura]|uniref:blood vessel epicardial substance isoform X1 n=1 Tax=Drosophila pseudoobscura pseudoobscura TaxID=46245 RepID=A0A6I8WAH0_DROPS|nr:blood vessel epicardial substance isoform X1 [Drosophila pseudoobscura]XP_033240393.1 blood vessel epicardial substance isoform X1 [Drosophila pseudoobscura]XP_033240394.1 blood vessel epicardial substance isoform X1 [Drosophila pseudoobscura]XP_033240395.1 blood vessel epicardial substance isoform X1 [Drosophila pseudoobscura]XP_033240396.1 blood vessel epicardial substance isoform X1 [Drosophila pseudoobscura]XP_033240398.1 blood vessel epicardial substance isoform X1 [Drosophila pseudoob